MLHCDILKQNELEIITIDIKDGIDKINKTKKGFALNLFANDKDIVDFANVELDKFSGDYFICISHTSSEIINKISQQVCGFNEIVFITDRKTKVGRFEKYEQIFQILDDTVPEIYIDEDGIPF
jgi:hypothetical protein